MDLVQGLSLHQLIKNITEEEKESVRDAWKYFVEQFHKFSKKFIHGDARDGNIIFGTVGNQKKQFYFIDFDWANSRGDACYPFMAENTH